MHPQQFGFAFRTIAFTGLNTFSKLFDGNRNRVSLTISCADTGVQSSLRFTAGSNQALVFAMLQNPGTFIMPYRDYGPLVMEEIWVLVQSPSPSFTISGVEIFKIAQNR